MPTYVYGCRACGKEFEIEQRITADSLTDCEACGAKGGLRRLIQPVAVSFKGAGFHINDYSTKPPPVESSDPAPSGSGGEAKPSESAPAETKADIKPAESAPVTKASEPTGGN